MRDSKNPEERAAWNAVQRRKLKDSVPATPPAPKREDVFSLGGDVELGIDLAQSLGGTGDVVVAENRLWRYESGLWRQWEDAELAKRAQGYNGRWVKARSNGEETVRPISLSNSNIEGIVKQCKVYLTRPDFFSTAPEGAPFRNVFARVVGGSVVLEPLCRDHRVKAQHCPDFDLDLSGARPSVCDALLAQTFGGREDADEIVAYIWECLGAALTGRSTRYKDSPLLYGAKDTGKSQILAIFTAAFPPSSHRCVPLHDMRIEHHRAELAGGRINSVNELPSSELLDGEAAKAIMSGDPVMCRRMREQPFQWASRICNIFSCNSLPQSKDRALMARFVLLECRNVIPDDRKDRDLADKIRAEAPQIAAMALAALPALLARGRFERPNSSHEAASAWSMASDTVLMWCVESVELLDSCVTPGKELYDHFVQWARENNHRVMASNVFAERLIGHKFERIRSNGAKWNAGIKSDQVHYPTAPTGRAYSGWQD